MPTYPWPLIRRLFDLAQDDGISGVAIRDQAACARLAFLRVRGAGFADLSDRMRRGLILHETTHRRDASTEGLLGLRPDLVDWTRRIVVEKKSSRATRDAAELQAAFYAALLAGATGEEWHGEVHVITERKRTPVRVDEPKVTRLIELADAVLRHRFGPVPKATKTGLCDACSERFLCGWGGEDGDAVRDA